MTDQRNENRLAVFDQMDIERWPEIEKGLRAILTSAAHRVRGQDWGVASLLIDVTHPRPSLIVGLKGPVDGGFFELKLNEHEQNLLTEIIGGWIADLENTSYGLWSLFLYECRQELDEGLMCPFWAEEMDLRGEHGDFDAWYQHLGLAEATIDCSEVLFLLHDMLNIQMDGSPEAFGTSFDGINRVYLGQICDRLTRVFTMAALGQRSLRHDWVYLFLRIEADDLVADPKVEVACKDTVFETFQPVPLPEEMRVWLVKQAADWRAHLARDGHNLWDLGTVLLRHGSNLSHFECYRYSPEGADEQRRRSVDDLAEVTLEQLDDYTRAKWNGG